MADQSIVGALSSSLVGKGADTSDALVQGADTSMPYRAFAAAGDFSATRKAAASLIDDMGIDGALVGAWASARAAKSDGNVAGALFGAGGPVTVSILADSGAGAFVASQLEKLGAGAVAQAGDTVSILMDAEALPSLMQVSGMASAKLDFVETHGQGAAQSQGEPAMETDTFSSRYMVDGSGVTIGIISDSFDTDSVTSGDGTAPITNYADDIASGDLPAGINVLLDLPEPANNTIDEGRAMAQLIHDIAPGADLAFHTGFPGVASMVTAIEALDDVSDIIVDDLGFLNEPVYQDGQIAQAAQNAFDAGIPYFSSAGNSDVQAYEDEYRPFVLDAASSAFLTSITGKTYTNVHNFSTTSGINDILQDVPLGSGQVFAPALQWATPFASANAKAGATGGATIDLDLFIFTPGTDPGSIVPFDSGSAVEIGGDAQALLDFLGIIAGTGGENVSFLIANASNVDPERIYYKNLFGNFDFVDLSTNGPVQWATGSGTSTGHASAEGAIGVGAADYLETPAFGSDPALLEDFSSVGDTPFLFEADGTPIPMGSADRTRDRVDIVAPQGTDTTFFPPSLGDPDSTGFPNFFGTSASAPHAAAATALLKEIVPEATPTQIYDALRASALSMDNPFTPVSEVGLVDVATGHGYINVDGALRLLANVVDGTPGNDSLSGTAARDVMVGDGGNDTLDGTAGNDRVIGGDGLDVLRGGNNDDILFGGAGADNLNGGPGNDTLNGGTDNSDDVLVGEGGNDLLIDTQGNDFLTGRSGNDTLESGSGNDTAAGGTGDDRIIAAAGDDQVLGQGDNDVLFAGTGNDFVAGGTGDDTMRGEGDNDDMLGQGGNDEMYGGSGNDTMQGGGGTDLLVGQPGNDVLDGWVGVDTLRGGGNDDTYVFSDATHTGVGAGNRDQIGTWGQGSDRIDVSAIDALPGGADDAFVFVGAAHSGGGGTLRAFTEGGSTIVGGDLTGDGLDDFQIQVIGNFTLTATDFIL